MSMRSELRLLRKSLRRNFDYYRRGLLCLTNRALERESIPRTNLIFVITSGVCNLACRFCHYPKKTDGKVISETDRFSDYIEQVGAYGIDHISLTPMTGEAMFDKRFLEKVDAIERSGSIKSFEVYSNFILAKPEVIDGLCRSRKFHSLTISLYGQDAETFTQITQRPVNQFDRLVANLEYLLSVADRWPAHTVLGMRNGKRFDWSPLVPGTGPESRLQAVLRELCSHPRFQWGGNYTNYDSWGGTVTPEDVKGLDIDISKRAGMPKVGACYMIFDEQAIMPDGRVNACACRAIDDSLIIGDLNKQTLSDVLSLSNPAYADLIERQQKGDFPAACRSCTWYKSIYFRKSRGNDPGYITMQAFRERNGRPAGVGGHD